MEETTFTKDETSYLIFACTKCKQFSYVKTVQKTKKCLRCGRTHRVVDILDKGEVVDGMTEAVNTVRMKQNELATPDFRSGSDFVVATRRVVKSKHIEKPLKSKDQEVNYAKKFNKLLEKLSALYKQFPHYMIEMMAEDYEIPAIELKTLINNAKKSGILIKNSEDLLSIKQK